MAYSKNPTGSSGALDVVARFCIDYIRRPRLLAELTEVLFRKIVCIVAPAGYGKSSLLDEWACHISASRADATIVRLKLSPIDDTPERFWSHVANATAETDVLPFDQIAKSILGEADDFEEGAIGFVRLLADCPTIVYVFDDFDCVSDGRLLRSFDRFLNQLPTNIHVVIAAKTMPRLSLERRKAKREASVLTVKQLRFTKDEIARFVMLNAPAKAETPDFADQVEQITAGWPIALQLLVAYLRSGEDIEELGGMLGNSTSDINLFLAHEIVEDLSSELADFMASTSFLDIFTVSLCDYVTAGKNSANFIEELVAQGLCTPVEKPGRNWYSYNYLVANYLSTRLISCDRQTASDLARRASEWFEMEGMVGLAISYAAKSHNWKRCADLVRVHYFEFINDTRFDTLAEAMASIPERQIIAHPYLLIAKVWVLLAFNKIEEADRLLKQGRMREFQFAGSVANSDRFATEIRILEATKAAQSGDLERTRELVEEAGGAVEGDIDLMSWNLNALGTAAARGSNPVEAIRILNACEDTAIGAGNYSVELVSRFFRGTQYLNMGKLGEAERLFSETLCRSDAGIRVSPYRGLSNLGLACVLYERNEIDAAERELDEGLKKIENLGVEFISTAWFMKARIEELKGNRDNARSLIDMSRALADVAGFARIRKLAGLQLAGILLNEGLVDDAYEITINLRLNKASEDIEVIEETSAIAARLLLYKGNAEGAVKVAEKLISRVEHVGRNSSLIKWNTILACARFARREKARALGAFEKALDLGIDEGYLRTFADACPGVGEVASQFVRANGSRRDSRYMQLCAYASRIAAVCESAAAPKRKEQLLTNREEEICRYLASGYSNKDIAKELNLSESTVHSHRMNIYGKLNVHNRKELMACLNSRT